MDKGRNTFSPNDIIPDGFTVTSGGKRAEHVVAPQALFAVVSRLMARSAGSTMTPDESIALNYLRVRTQGGKNPLESIEDLPKCLKVVIFPSGDIIFDADGVRLNASASNLDKYRQKST